MMRDTDNVVGIPESVLGNELLETRLSVTRAQIVATEPQP
jgi:hypothetical protein